MADVLVLGGGICGLAAAMMLARDGHEVTVLERDPDGPPESVDNAVESWDRPGVGQFQQAHYMHARFRHVVDENLPDVRDRLIALGALEYDLLNEVMPETLEDRSPREGDDKYWTLTGRRPCLELAMAQAAADEPRLKIMRGIHVTGFLTGAEAISGVPHVTGARTFDGDELRADVVVDAMGRRSETPQWIANVGGRRPYEEAEDSGFTYYGRYFRSRDGKLPKVVGALLSVVGSISILSLPGDNGTWMTALFTASGDMELKQLRFEEKWRKVVAAVPNQAHWLDGDPIGDLESMSGIMDRYRRFVVDGVPVVTGLLPVADAWACTNPSFGRGVSLGIWHAARLRDLLGSSNGDPGSTAVEWDAMTDAELTPWYQTQKEMDHARIAEIIAIRKGRELPQQDDPATQMRNAFFTAMNYDADCYRAFLEVMGCMATPEETLSRPGLFEKMIAAADGKEVPVTAGPNRAELLELIA